MHIGKHPYSFYLLFLILGIFLYPYSFFSWKIWFTILILVFLLSIFIFNSIRFKILFSVLSLFCWLLLGLIIVGINTNQSDNHYSHFIEKNKKQYISVVIDEQNNSNEKNRKYTAEVHSISYKGKLIHTSGKVLLLFNKIKTDSILKIGDEYGVIVKIQDPSKNLNPYQFNYKNYLQRNYISNLGITYQIIYQKKHSSLWYKIKNINQLLCLKIDSSYLNSDSKEFLKAYLLGNRSDMKKDNIQAYSKAGIMHLIAISGMHIALIFGIIFNVLTICFSKKKRVIIIISSLACVWLFGCFVGLSSSVSRACLMITIYYVSDLLKRNPGVYHSLSLSAIIILLYNPYEIYSVGFQLSYTAVFFMCWLNPICLKYLKTHSNTINKWVMEPLSITIVAQIGTLPLVLYYFHQISLLSIPANILIIPYTYVITYSSIIELGVVYLPYNLQFYFNCFYNFCTQLLIKGSYWISSSDFASFKGVYFNEIEIVFLFLALVFTKFFLQKPKIKNIIPILIFMFLFQVNRLWEEYKISKKENFIVFHQNKHPLIGFRKGKILWVLKDKNEDLIKIMPDIIQPYADGEGIKQLKYQDIDYKKIYIWKNKKIQILNNTHKDICDSITYLVSPISLNTYKDISSIKKIIKTGVNFYELDNEKQMSNLNVWNTQYQGAFIVP